MSDTDTKINFAAINGIHKGELPAAIAFAAVYAPLFVVYIIMNIRIPTYVFRTLALFCLVRTAAFTMRAILAGVPSTGENVNFVVAEQVIYSIGFAGLLYSAYTLVLDRDSLTNTTTRGSQSSLPGPLGFVVAIMRNRMLVRLACTAAIVLGVIGGIKQVSYSNPHDQQTGNDFRRVSLYIFLVVVVMLAVVTVNLALDERSVNGWSARGTSIGRQHGVFILGLVVILCFVRDVYLVATAGNTAKQNKAVTWYPLAAGTELLCAILLLAPGLVPSRYELLNKDLYVGGMEPQRVVYPATYPTTYPATYPAPYGRNVNGPVQLVVRR